VHILLLGSAAGGGFPQWNCWCVCCRTARADPDAARPRTQSSVAISSDGRRWFLLNASPDVREQLGRIPRAAGGSTVEAGSGSSPVRHVPIEGVLLTDAELDHSLGVVLLREAKCLPLFATSATRSVLERDSRLLPVTRAFADVPFTELVLDQPLRLRHADGSLSDLSVEAFAVPAGPPQFAPDATLGHTVGLLIGDERSGRTCAFVPGCGDLTPPLLQRLARVDVLLFDGTFWDDQELSALGISSRTAREMDHLPISGPGGSLERIATLPCRHRVYTHINNTNPVLLERSPERKAVVRAGLIVGYDDLYITL
jgi:pyrroloquinoline quinone biosynthesis protein B